MVNTTLGKKRGGRISKRPDIDTLSSLYAVKSASEIAAMYGVSEATVRAWIARYRRDLYAEASKEAETARR